MSRKRKKEDRAKTQLKKPKTAPGKFLPKGTNETKTDFKITKIVIPGQQINAPTDGPTTSKNIGLRDILSKLGHFSQAVRQDGLEGLKELLSGVDAGAVVVNNLSRLVTILIGLVQDKEKKIRKLSVTLLGMTLGHVSGSQITPLYPLISAHLSCCLTNIDPRIQQDGLSLLDTILDKTPCFVEENYHAILPNCLDQISNKKTSGSKGPNVAANLSDSMTALQWRMAVLTRVNKILEIAQKATDNEEKGHKTDSLDRKHLPNTFYSVMEHSSPFQNIFSINSLTSESNHSAILDNCLLVLPLLIETWVEARATETKSSKTSVLTKDSCDLLHIISGIMDKLLLLLENSSQSEGANMVGKFKTKFWKDIKQHFLQYLPYKSPNPEVYKCNALLCCIGLMLDGDLDIAKVGVEMCSNKHVTPGLKIRTATKVLQQTSLSDQLRSDLMSALACIVEAPGNDVDFEDKQRAIELLKSEVLAHPNQQNSNMWLEKLPSLLCATEEEGLRLELLRTCLHLVKCKVKPLAASLACSWDTLLENGSGCHKSTQILGFIKFYCDILA